ALPARGRADGGAGLVSEGGRDGEASRRARERARVLESHPDSRRLRVREGLPGREALSRRARVPDLRRGERGPEDAERAAPPAAMNEERPLLVALLALTFVTGIVDAVSYLGLGHVFTANMTGNVVLLGFAVAGASGLSVPRSSLSLLGFLAGAVCGGAPGRVVFQTPGAAVV